MLKELCRMLKELTLRLKDLAVQEVGHMEYKCSR